MEKITYTIKKSKRAKQMRLVVYRDGRVVVTTPYLISSWFVDRFVEKKKKWLLRKIFLLKQFQDSNFQKLTKKDYFKNKDKASELIIGRLKYFSQTYNFQFNDVRVKDQKSRWGSCSSKRNLNFNYKIVFLPQELQDYIIVHELCHLKEFNHSVNFWNLVAQAFPDYKDQRKKLKSFGLN